MEVAIPEISSAESPITQKLKLVKEKETPPFVTDKIRKFHHATANVIDTFALDKDLDLREDETNYLGQMIEYHLAKKSLLSLNQIPPTQQNSISRHCELSKVMNFSLSLPPPPQITNTVTFIVLALLP